MQNLNLRLWRQRFHPLYLQQFRNAAGGLKNGPPSPSSRKELRANILLLGPRNYLLNPPWKSHRIQDPGPRIQDPGSRIQDPGSSILEPGSWIQDPGSCVIPKADLKMDPPSSGKELRVNILFFRPPKLFFFRKSPKSGHKNKPDERVATGFYRRCQNGTNNLPNL